MSTVWENKYHELFHELNEMKRKYEKHLEIEQIKCEDMEEECTELKSTITKLADEIKEKDNQISDILKDRVNMTDTILDLENTLIVTKSALVTSEKEKHHLTEQIFNDEEKRQIQIEQITKEFQDKCKDIEILKEKNQELTDTLNEYKDGLRSQNIKCFNNYDVIFSKYIEAFPTDEPNLRAIFQDPVSQGSNLSFQMLVQLCYDDIVLNIGDFVYYVDDAAKMLEEIIKFELFVRFCQYARIMQFKNPQFFHDTTDAFSKNKELTRHKIAYEEVEIVTARTQFVLSLIKSITLNNENEVKDHPKQKKKKKENKMIFDKPVGFDDI